MVAARFLISGKVQGVFFRASTREQALRLNLSGRARNLADGRVEVVVAGETEAIEALGLWLWEGPPSAKVVEVVRSTCDEKIHAGFAIA